MTGPYGLHWMTGWAAGDGSVQAEAKLPEPLWDGLALAQGRLFCSTRDGRLLCLGKQ